MFSLKTVELKICTTWYSENKWTLNVPVPSCIQSFVQLVFETVSVLGQKFVQPGMSAHLDRCTSGIQSKRLTLKEPSKIAADDTFIIFFTFIF